MAPKIVEIYASDHNRIVIIESSVRVNIVMIICALHVLLCRVPVITRFFSSVFYSDVARVYGINRIQ